MKAAVITASAGILVAVLVFVLNQLGQARTERRQAKLDRVNSQLRDLYGPLYALVDVNERIWEALHDAGLPSKRQREHSTEWEPWHTWVDRALMPANIKMRDLVLNHADLLLDGELSPAVQQFCAHVTSYEVLLSTGTSSGGHALIRHPGSEYVNYVRRSFRRLQTEQSTLLSGARLR
ncbi:hypothetical protein ACPYPG_02270 [Streptomyces sp. FR-108]|uniref:hypothetical protein n=1 Tax=Streptomyces sp. FR-108 TaxID=3416665 RepID=UPI003CE74D32